MLAEYNRPSSIGTTRSSALSSEVPDILEFSSVNQEDDDDELNVVKAVGLKEKHYLTNDRRAKNWLLEHVGDNMTVVGIYLYK